MLLDGGPTGDSNVPAAMSESTAIIARSGKTRTDWVTGKMWRPDQPPANHDQIMVVEFQLHKR